MTKVITLKTKRETVIIKYHDQDNNPQDKDQDRENTVLRLTIIGHCIASQTVNYVIINTNPLQLLVY